MTTPAQAKQSRSDAPRMYAWPPTGDPEFEVISVTSALGAGLPKPFLIGWAAKVAAECAVDRLEIVTKMVDSGEQRAAIDFIKGARFRSMGEKAERGTLVHAAMEAYLAGTPLDKKALEEALYDKRVPKHMWKGAHGMVAGVLQYLQDTEPEVWWSERTVYSRTHGYAGTADLIGLIPIDGARVPAVLDVKTSARVYDEVALQLVAYARADFVGSATGEELPLIGNPKKKPPPRPSIDFGVVVRPMTNGTYEAINFAFTDELFDRFLAILAVAKTTGLEAKSRRP